MSSSIYVDHKGQIANTSNWQMSDAYCSINYRSVFQNLVKYLIMNLFAKISNGYKGEFKSCQTSEMKLFRKLLRATEANSEFMMELLQIQIYYGASVFLQAKINLTNVIKIFVFFGISITKEVCIYRYFHIL